MAEAAGELHKTFHRAFDMCRNPRKAAGDIRALGFDRILTSGQAPSATEGTRLLGKLQSEFSDVIFIAAGGVSPANAAEIVTQTGVRELHASAKIPVGSGMTYRKSGISMGQPDADEYARHTSSPSLVARIVEALTQ